MASLAHLEQPCLKMHHMQYILCKGHTYIGRELRSRRKFRLYIKSIDGMCVLLHMHFQKYISGNSTSAPNCNNGPIYCLHIYI